MVYNFFDKKSQGSGAANNNENIQLADELHQQIIREFKKTKVHSSLRDNIWGTDLADMKLISQFNKGFRFLLCVIDIFSRYVWVIPLKDKKGVSIVNAFQKILDDSKRKPNEIWVDKGSEFYNNSFKKWLQDNNNIVIYSTNNEGKSAVAGRVIRTINFILNLQIHDSNIKNVFIGKLDDIVKEYNNTFHTSIKMKPVNVKDNTYIDFKKEINDKYPKFKVGYHVRISEYKNIFAKGYMPNLSEEIFVIKKNTVPWTYVINDLNGEEIIGTFYEQELQGTRQMNLGQKK